jgi:hypothetical protein
MNILSPVELHSAPATNLINVLLEAVLLYVTWRIRVENDVAFSVLMKQDVRRAIVVHATVDEMDSRRVLYALRARLICSFRREMVHEVMLVACM